MKSHEFYSTKQQNEGGWIEYFTPQMEPHMQLLILLLSGKKERFQILLTVEFVS